MIKNNNYLDSLSQSLLNDVRGVMEGKKGCDKECKCEKCEKPESKAEEKAEKKEEANEAYDETAVNKAIKSSRQKIGGREAKKIHALLKGSSGYKPKWTKDEADAITAKIKADNKGVKEEVELEEAKMVYKKVLGQHTVHIDGKFHRSFPTEGDAVKYISSNEKKKDVKEEVEEVNEISKKLATDYFHAKQDKARKDFMRGRPTSKKGVMLAKDKIEGRAKVPATCEEVEVVEAKAESPIAGTRLISKHEGKDGHHAEVRFNKDYDDYQVHHYNNGKHMGEGPVSYHGGGKEGREDATETAEYEVKNYRPKGKSLHQFKEGLEINEEVDFAKVRKQFDRNEDRNEHSKNAVLVAKHCGSEVDHKEAKDIMNQHNKIGHLSGPLIARRSALYDKLKKTDNYKKIFPEENVKEEIEQVDEDKVRVGTLAQRTQAYRDEKLVGNQKKLDKNNNGKLDKQDFKMLRKEETIEEKLNPSMGSAKYIEDFVKSKDPRFEGKTKQERIKMALGAYYGAKNEEVEIEETDHIEEANGGKNYTKRHIIVNGKYIASTTWAKDSEEAKRRFLKQHPEHKNAVISVSKER